MSAPHPMQDLLGSTTSRYWFIPVGTLQAWGAHSLPRGQFHCLFSLFLFKGNGSHLSLRGSALQLWIIIRILLLEATCEGQPAVTRGPKGLRTNLGTGGWKWGWRVLEKGPGNAWERGEMW